MKRVNLELSEELFASVKAAAGDVPVNRWIRRTIEQALREPSAERPYRQHVPSPDVENVRSSSQAKRDVKPIPKKRS